MRKSTSTHSRGQITEPSVAEQAFARARREAVIQDILAPLRNEPVDLLRFEEVRKSLNLGSQTYRGIQQVPLDRIVGSVARYHDFSRAFRPRRDSLRERWQRALDMRGRLPPIDVYNVGDVYFVVDGNHRVSVTREAGARTIEAHVWEYKTRVPVESNDAFNDILIRQEYLEFLEQSHLDINRPEQRIVFTVPGRYRQLGVEMARHREWLDRQHIYTVSFEEAATNWFDTVYMPMVKVIRKRNVLSEFPGRTEADLVAYILRYRDELRQQWGQVPSADATSLVDTAATEVHPEQEESQARSKQVAEAFARKIKQDWWRRIVAWIKRRVLRWEVLDRGSRED